MATFTDMEDAALVRELTTQEVALVKARFALSLGRLESTASLRGIRRSIAQIKTEIRRRELDQGLAKDALLAAHAVKASEVAGAGSDAASGGFLKGVVDKLGAQE